MDFLELNNRRVIGVKKFVLFFSKLRACYLAMAA